ncbi:MAG TPA: cobalamin-dependent protein [Baekduia sp.]|nr:cobalamin-dependent protein [Baekduia sp.]
MTSRAPDPAARGDHAEAFRDRFLETLLAPDTRAAWHVVEQARAAGMTPAQIYVSVLAPAMEAIGVLWERAQIGVAQEHLATQITQTLLARLAPELGDGRVAAGPMRLALVGGTPGELHALGARMVADFLESGGWDVLMLGPDTPADEIVATAAAHRPEVVALSTALPSNLLPAARVFGALRRLDPPPLLVAGGRAYDGRPQRALTAGADLFATDPVALLDDLRARLG